MPATNGTVVRSGSMPGAQRGATGERPEPATGAITGTPVVPRRSDGGRSRSYQRRSAGPPGAGALGLATNASWERVSERRGTASRVTVTRISRRGDRLPRTTMSAAPVAAPRRRPSPRKASSLAVTRGQGPRCPAPPGAPSLPASVATRIRRVNPRPPAVARSGSPRNTLAGHAPHLHIRLVGGARNNAHANEGYGHGHMSGKRLLRGPFQHRWATRLPAPERGPVID